MVLGPFSYPVMIALVLGSGGHTSEMMKIVSGLPSRYQNHSHLVVHSDEDKLSASKYLK